MPSIFDYLFGGGPQQAATSPLPGISGAANATPSILDPLNNKMAGRDALMGLSQGLLAAGGPSQYPVGMLDAIGKGVSGALSAREGGEDKHLKRALVSAQVQKAQSDIANDKAWQDMFKTPAAAATSPVSSVTPPVGVPTPLGPAVGGGGPSNPTNPGNLADGRGGFQTFKSPEEGVAAAIKLAQDFPKRYNGGQPMTLAQVEAHWAPPDDGKDPMTRGNKQGIWSGNVARGMGIDPNTPLDFSNPQVGFAFAKAVHQAEHPAGSAYAPDIYNRGAQLAYGQTPAAPAGAPPLGPIAQPPIMQASTGAAPGMPPQGDAPPVAGPQMAQAAPAAPPPKTLPQVIQSLPPAVRQMMGAMPRKDALPLLMKYADPETHVAIDTTTGAVVFAPKNDNSGRYQPVDAMKLDIDKQRVETERRQAAAREEANRIRGANEPMQPPIIPGGTPTPTPGYTEQKGAEEAAKADAKVPAALRQHQGELVIKDVQGSQVSADHARVGIGNLSRMESLLNQVNTNKFQGTTQEFKASAKALGFDLDALGVGDNVGVAQAANALSNQLALQLRDPSAGTGMPGAMSDPDREFLRKSVAGITNDPNANKLMIDWQKKIYQRQLDVAKIVNDYGRSSEFLKDPTGVYAKVREYAEKNPLFDPEKDAPKPPAAASGGSLQMPQMNAIDAEIARRRKAGAK